METLRAAILLGNTWGQGYIFERAGDQSPVQYIIHLLQSDKNILDGFYRSSTFTLLLSLLFEDAPPEEMKNLLLVINDPKISEGAHDFILKSLSYFLRDGERATQFMRYIAKFGEHEAIHAAINAASEVYKRNKKDDPLIQRLIDDFDKSFKTFVPNDISAFLDIILKGPKEKVYARLNVCLANKAFVERLPDISREKLPKGGCFLTKEDIDLLTDALVDALTGRPLDSASVLSDFICKGPICQIWQRARLLSSLVLPPLKTTPSLYGGEL